MKFSLLNNSLGSAIAKENDIINLKEANHKGLLYWIIMRISIRTRIFMKVKMIRF